MPGASTTIVVCARLTTSTSDCPAPTVSIRMKPYPAASKTWLKASVCSANPPSAPREAMERMKICLSSCKSSMRTRSPRIAPPVKGLDGSTAMMATFFSGSRRRNSRVSAFTNVLLPEPGGPVMPILCAVPVSRKSSSSAAMPASVPFSTWLKMRERASLLPFLSESIKAEVIPTLSFLQLHGCLCRLHACLCPVRRPCRPRGRVNFECHLRG